MTRDDISLAVACDRNISKVGKLTTFRLQEEATGPGYQPTDPGLYK